MKEYNNILNQFSKKKGQIAILIDPEKYMDIVVLAELIKKAEFAAVDYLFIGGSTASREEFNFVIDYLKERTKLPLVIFPGGSHQLSEKADGLLYLSLISGRNPDYLIGHHVTSANEVFDMDIEVMPTAYILVDGGTNSSVAYVSQTTPIPGDKSSIIMNTAKAGILQGKKILYLDAGSGALNLVPYNVVVELNALNFPIIVGGGIRSLEEINNMKNAGANVIVIGNKIEEDIDFLLDIKNFISKENQVK